MQNSRNPSVDVLKGALILSVFAGHLFTEGVSQNVWKWTLYGFHMPLFLGLSGALLSLDKVRSTTFKAYFRGALDRYLLPWAIALMGFVLVTHKLHPSPGIVAKSLIHAPYHLWFVPVLFIFTSVAKLTRVSRWTLFLVALAVGVLADFTIANGNWRLSGSTWVKALGEKRLYTMAMFFFFGVLVSLKGGYGLKLLSPRFAAVASLAAATGFSLYLASFYPVFALLALPSNLLLNAALILLLPVLLTTSRLSFAPLERVGLNSLYYYLWHPFFFLVCKKLVYPRLPEPLSFSVTLFGTFAILYFADHLLSATPVAKLIGLIPEKKDQAIAVGALPETIGMVPVNYETRSLGNAEQ